MNQKQDIFIKVMLTNVLSSFFMKHPTAEPFPNIGNLIPKLHPDPSNHSRPGTLPEPRTHS